MRDESWRAYNTSSLTTLQTEDQPIKLDLAKVASLNGVSMSPRGARAPWIRQLRHGPCRSGMPRDLESDKAEPRTKKAASGGHRSLSLEPEPRPTNVVEAVASLVSLSSGGTRTRPRAQPCETKKVKGIWFQLQVHVKVHQQWKEKKRLEKKTVRTKILSTLQAIRKLMTDEQLLVVNVSSLKLKAILIFPLFFARLGLPREAGPSSHSLYLSCSLSRAQVTLPVLVVLQRQHGKPILHEHHFRSDGSPDCYGVQHFQQFHFSPWLSHFAKENPTFPFLVFRDDNLEPVSALQWNRSCRENKQPMAKKKIKALSQFDLRKVCPHVKPVLLWTTIYWASGEITWGIIIPSWWLECIVRPVLWTKL